MHWQPFMMNINTVPISPQQIQMKCFIDGWGPVMMWCYVYETGQIVLFSVRNTDLWCRNVADYLHMSWRKHVLEFTFTEW